MTSTVRYQIIVVEPRRSRFGATLAGTVRSRFRDLGLRDTDYVQFFDARSCEDCDLRSPTVGIFVGSRNHDAAAAQALQRLLRAAHVIIPVVDNLADFPVLVPTELGRINAFARDPHDTQLDKLASLILEALNLLRDKRRLFISYRRSESTPMADQLCTALERSGYHVFLDTQSVRPGDDFQDELFHRLADTEVMLLLDTKSFMKSRWTAEELAQASALAVGIVQIVWPDHKPSPTTDLCQRMYLRSGDFSLWRQGELKASTLRRIIVNVERLRARSLAARHANLVKEFCDAARRAGWTADVQINRHVTIQSPSGRNVTAIPTVGVPTAQDYDVAARQFNGPAHGQAVARLLYDDRGVRDGWRRHLEWLDRHLPVQSLRVTAAYDSLRGT